MEAETENSSDTADYLIAAIDFGTAHSGFAFAVNKTGLKVDDIHLHEWDTLEDTPMAEWKAPTTVLLNNKQEFIAFGFEAESKYAAFCEENTQAEYYYFRKFKMLLYDTENISLDTKINDEQGKSMLAVDVFAKAISYLKDELIDTVKLSKMFENSDGILYVLTVPAIWSDAAKQFMQEAAFKAGIKGEQLKLALEPEAASVYCQRIFAGKFQAGFRYVVVDMGGGTVDIATHEVTSDGNLTEIHNAVGNNFGGLRFDEQYLTLLQGIFGEHFETWKDAQYNDLLALEKKIEVQKRRFSDANDDIALPIPHSLSKIILNVRTFFWKKYDSVKEFIKTKCQTFKQIVNKTGDDKLHLKTDCVKGFFEDTVKGVTTELGEIVKEIPNIEAVVLVGGLANCKYIRNRIKDKLKRIQVISPLKPGLAVLKGAVLLGNKPQTITGRIARFTYGIDVSPEFVEGKHPDDHKFTRDGEVLCRHVFSTMIEKGTLLKYGARFSTKTYIRAKEESTKKETFTSHLYRSTEIRPSYTTDEGCIYLGGFDKKPPEGGWPDFTESTVEIEVGEAEFKFYVTQPGRERFELKFNFLNSKKKHTNPSNSQINSLRPADRVGPIRTKIYNGYETFRK